MVRFRRMAHSRETMSRKAEIACCAPVIKAPRQRRSERLTCGLCSERNRFYYAEDSGGPRSAAELPDDGSSAALRCSPRKISAVAAGAGHARMVRPPTHALDCRGAPDRRSVVRDQCLEDLVLPGGSSSGCSSIWHRHTRGRRIQVHRQAPSATGYRRSSTSISPIDGSAANMHSA
jgi:hypothetical protein